MDLAAALELGLEILLENLRGDADAADRSNAVAVISPILGELLELAGEAGLDDLSMEVREEFALRATLALDSLGLLEGA